MHKFEIKQRKNSKGVMTGGNTSVYMDGKLVRGCYAAAFEVNAKGIAKLTLSLYGKMAISGKTKKPRVKNAG